MIPILGQYANNSTPLYIFRRKLLTCIRIHPINPMIQRLLPKIIVQTRGSIITKSFTGILTAISIGITTFRSSASDKRHAISDAKRCRSCKLVSCLGKSGIRIIDQDSEHDALNVMRQSPVRINRQKPVRNIEWLLAGNCNAKPVYCRPFFWHNVRESSQPSNKGLHR